MTDIIEELHDLIDVGGARFGRAPRYSRRQPINVEQAVRMAAAKDLLTRLDVGKAMVVSHTVAEAVKLAARGCEGVKISVRKIDNVSTNLVRLS